MTTTPQSMSDLPELPEPSINTANHANVRVIGYTADQLREYGRICRATAEQAGKVDMADCCDTPHYCSSVRRCTRQDAKPTQPAAPDHSTAMEGWFSAIDNVDELLVNAPDDRYASRARLVMAYIKANRPVAAPVSPSREVEALAVKWRGIAKQQRIAADRDDDRGDTESAARMRGMAERSEYCANEIEYICALAPVQEKAP